MIIQRLDELAEVIEVPLATLNQHYLDTNFKLKVPVHFARQIEKGNLNDPLLRQILPSIDEAKSVKGFSQDPVGDLNANPIDSLLHKYQGRALLITSPQCDIHCRYCFRRHFPYEQAKKRHWQTALEHLASDNSIHEIILSGGDPLTLSETGLLELLRQLEQIPHIETLRIHSRTPVVAPERALKLDWLAALKASRFNVVLVVHCNHPNELSDETKTLFEQYRRADVTLLNQSVLLKGINDSAPILKALSKKLFSQGILPYYCHLLDRVEGASHFEVDDTPAWQIFETLRKELPGYLVPKLVREIAGEPYKTPIIKTL
ncbi:EF-P beta-lysylation protein EpmB [Hydrogenovibrio kuenenii]|uniref:EF-P beta-lysylation protein EpmB n=1 Tax=Hydrogenovibrio kuenenii TaxID=63658 RepID=UPI000467E361|nr:EF-P beta-lysylation protein EpmB [Hydrogenovibrio kuenenii]